jgi:hypothetical protein
VKFYAIVPPEVSHHAPIDQQVHGATGLITVDGGVVSLFVPNDRGIGWRVGVAGALRILAGEGSEEAVAISQAQAQRVMDRRATGMLAEEDGVLLALFGGVGEWRAAGPSASRVFVGDDVDSAVPITRVRAEALQARLAPGEELPTSA